MEVIPKNVKSHPSCPHGPTLMFERYTTDGRKTGRRFFACSACRDRKDCNFFRWVDDHVSAQTKEHWKFQKNKTRPPFSHAEFMHRLTTVKTVSSENRMFCKSCSILLLPEEENSHKNHEILCNLDSELESPTCLLAPLKNSKVEAQYFFNAATADFLVQLIQRLNYTRIVCIGTPKIHESIKSLNVNVTSMLLDIDFRYMQFYDNLQFCHYNLFNNCFFGGIIAKETFKKFMCSDDGNNIAIFIDPPFGGLVDAISYTLKKIVAWWRKGCKKDAEEEIPMFMFFPYFNEGRIVESLPKMCMMDYKVEYCNHKRFKVRKRGSPVRIFTNIEPSLFFLSEEEGYHYCDICKRYVCKENQHCLICKACTTKDGATYKHCNTCKICVKSSYEHCPSCNKCVLPTHDCNDASNVLVCRACSGVGHKVKDCPLKSEGTPRKKPKVA